MLSGYRLRFCLSYWEAGGISMFPLACFLLNYSEILVSWDCHDMVDLCLPWLSWYIQMTCSNLGWFLLEGSHRDYPKHGFYSLYSGDSIRMKMQNQRSPSRTQAHWNVVKFESKMGLGSGRSMYPNSKVTVTGLASWEGL